MPDRRSQIRDACLARIERGNAIMGIINTTPDSFSDGGTALATDQAIARARALIAQGADILDIGGESTRPGAPAVSEDDERARTAPALAGITALGDTPVSIDTSKAAIARMATATGAVMVNDIWGMTRDPAMAQTVAETASLVVVAYNRGRIDPELSLVDDMRAFFKETLERAGAAGIPRAHVILDPGIGFSKTYEQNFEALARLDALADFGRPILVGVSRKSFIGRLLDAPVDDRLAGTLAADLFALERGAAIVRVHDVAAHAQAIKMFAALGRF